MRSGVLIAKLLAWSAADEIIVVVSLKRPGPAGASFLDYAFENRADGTAFITHYLFACAGVRTANGQIYAVTNRIREGKDNKASAIIMSFPSIVDGKPLISHRDEKLEFRFILNQRVFETTFIVNSADFLTGRKRHARLPGWMNPNLPCFPDSQEISGTKLISYPATQDAPAADAASALSTWPLQSACSQ